MDTVKYRININTQKISKSCGDDGSSYKKTDKQFII